MVVVPCADVRAQSHTWERAFFVCVFRKSHPQSRKGHGSSRGRQDTWLQRGASLEVNKAPLIRPCPHVPIDRVGCARYVAVIGQVLLPIQW